MRDICKFYLCDQQRLCCTSSTCGRECIYTDDVRHAIIKDEKLRNYDIDDHGDIIYYWETVSDLNNQ